MIDKRLAVVQQLEQFFKKSYGDPNFQEPPQLEKGPAYDIAIPCFPFASVLKKAPPKIAEEICAKLKAADWLPAEQIDAVNGFVNIRLRPECLAKHLEARLSDPLKDSRKSFADQRLVVDYSSPNIAKPFGIGHLRSTNIGAAVCRIYSALGAEVVRVNHLGDWGTQFGKLITAYKRFGNADFVKGDPINNLYKLYVQFHEEEKNDSALLDEAREWFVKLENGDEEAKELWAWFKDVSYREFKKIYDRLGVDFDYVTGESFYNNLMKESVERLEKSGLMVESDGAMVVDLEKYKMPPCLIKKTDGSTLYATRDISTAEYRKKTYDPTQLVYVVGGEQKLHFRQVFKVLELMGHEWAKNYVHVDFGLIKFADGKMSTRKGNIILLEEVLDRAEKEVLSIIEEKEKSKPEDKRLSEQEKIDVAAKVGVGAIVFFDLKAKRTKDVQFDWKSILSFEGDSGPYLQYTVVRLSGILEKARQEGYDPDVEALPLPETEEERALARRLLNFPAAIEAAAREYEPSIISNELMELASSFNRFYTNVSILKGDVEKIPGRLNLLKMTRQAMLEGLGLFGIHCPDRM